MDSGLLPAWGELMIGPDSHFGRFVESRTKSAPGSIASIAQIATRFVSDPDQLPAYDGREERTSLLVGQVQSGKTGHYLGIVAKVADEFPNIRTFLVLTQSLVSLQQQTLAEARQYLSSFEVFDETDELRFRQSLLTDMPRIVVLKKVSRPLRSWSQLLNPRVLCGQPLFIVDDEADASGLNTRVNQGDQSQINQFVEKIVTENSAYLLQVTATPHALFLQDSDSKLKPKSHLYFSPGANYLGGDFFFPRWSLGETSKPFHLQYTEEDELSQLEDPADPGLPTALSDAVITFWLTAAFRMQVEGDPLCNFLIHPSAKTSHHELISQKVNQFLMDLRDQTGGLLEHEATERVYGNLRNTKPQLPDIADLVRLAERIRLDTYVLNSRTNRNRQLPLTGANIAIGGNVLSRGIVLPRLQTAYYCRKARMPQLDTYWQHSRMFGYDRDPALVRIFMPPSQFRLFALISDSVSKLFTQLETGNTDDVALIVPKGIRPTRSSVVRGLSDSCLVGGSIYFPVLPDQNNDVQVSRLVARLSRDSASSASFEVTADVLAELLVACGENHFAGVSALEMPAVLQSISNMSEKILLSVRTNRAISANTGTVLSQSDRELMVKNPKSIHLMLYRVTGDKALGWLGQPFWIPNIKLPDGSVAYVRP